MENIRWLWTMKKPQVCLAVGLHEVSIPMMQSNYGISMDLPIKYVDGDAYFGEQAIQEFTRHISEKISQDPAFPDKIAKRIEEEVAYLNQTVKELEKVKPGELSDTELVEQFFKGYDAIARVTAFMSFKGTVQMADILEKKVRDILSAKITDVEELNDSFLLLSLPQEDSFMVQAQKSMLRIGIAHQKGEGTEPLLEEHAKRFAWMGCIMFTGTGYTKNDFKQELKKAVQQDCEAKLAELEAKKKENEQKVKQLVEKLGFDEQQKEILRQFRSWVHLRTYVKDMTSVGMMPTLPLLREIAKRIGVEYKDVLYLSRTELHDIFSDQQPLEDVEKRQQKWGWTVIELKDTYYHVDNINEIEEKQEEITQGVKGFPACKGVVKGKVIVVKSTLDLESIQQGDILITHMTTANFVPYLSKVSAIVTDEGGITCHAAIVSREMNIPCVIGTKIATKAFRTGDVVEVDANKGTVDKKN
jgi:phosphohistidine swiveling domain-containing protein